MRTLTALFLALFYQSPWLWALVPVALAWDVFETFIKKAVSIQVQKSDAPVGNPMGNRIAEMLAARQQCAVTNNCTDCKAFVAQFKAMVLPEDAPVDHSPAQKAGPVFAGGGYL